MTKFKAREPEVVDAYQFTGGEKDGKALVALILNGSANARWFPQDRHHRENIHIVGDNFSDRMYVGDWLVFREDNILTYIPKDDFDAKYEKVKFPRSAS